MIMRMRMVIIIINHLNNVVIHVVVVMLHVKNNNMQKFGHVNHHQQKFKVLIIHLIIIKIYQKPLKVIVQK
eukprot:UN10787